MRRQPVRDERTDGETRQQLLGERWWTTAFLGVMRPGTETTETIRGRRLCERGQVVIRGIHPGGVDAIVLGAVGGSHTVSLWVADPGDDWHLIFRILAIEKELFTRLLSGEYAEELDTLFKKAGISLIPETMMDLDYRCDCESSHHTCSHIVATYLTLGRYINEDPLTLFLLRGKSREEVIRGVDSLNDPGIEDEDCPGDEDGPEETGEEPDPSRFYETGPGLPEMRYQGTIPEGAETRLIRLLGPSPFRIGKTDLSYFITNRYKKARRFLETEREDSPEE